MKKNYFRVTIKGFEALGEFYAYPQDENNDVFYLGDTMDGYNIKSPFEYKSLNFLESEDPKKVKEEYTIDQEMIKNAMESLGLEYTNDFKVYKLEDFFGLGKQMETHSFNDSLQNEIKTLEALVNSKGYIEYNNGISKIDSFEVVNDDDVKGLGAIVIFKNGESISCDEKTLVDKLRTEEEYSIYISNIKNYNEQPGLLNDSIQYSEYVSEPIPVNNNDVEPKEEKIMLKNTFLYKKVNDMNPQPILEDGKTYEVKSMINDDKLEMFVVEVVDGDETKVVYMRTFEYADRVPFSSEDIDEYKKQVKEAIDYFNDKLNLSVTLDEFEGNLKKYSKNVVNTFYSLADKVDMTNIIDSSKMKYVSDLSNNFYKKIKFFNKNK